MKKLNDMTQEELKEYLSDLTIDKIPLGDSKFKCEKHDRILSYADIIAGCWFCIEEQATLLGFFIFAFCVLFGYADVIQNFGSKYNPPNFWLGFVYKLITGFSFIFCYLLIIKRYEPYHI